MELYLKVLKISNGNLYVFECNILQKIYPNISLFVKYGEFCCWLHFGMLLLVDRLIWEETGGEARICRFPFLKLYTIFN